MLSWHNVKDWLQRRQGATVALEGVDRVALITLIEYGLAYDALFRFQPTAANVNGLPEGLRRYIADLETDCDPSGTIAALACQRENAEALAAKVRELEEEAAQWRKFESKGLAP